MLGLLGTANNKANTLGVIQCPLWVRFLTDNRDVRFTPKADICSAITDVCQGPIADIICVSAVAPLEPLSASLTLRIGEIAVKREADILHQGINAKMKALGRLAPLSSAQLSSAQLSSAQLSHMVEGPVELRQIFNFDHQMKVAKCRLT